MIKHLGVIGAGTMGAGIAQAAALWGIDVILYDVNDTVLRRAQERIKSDFKKGVERGKLTDEQTGEAFQRIHTRTRLADFGHSEVVIEAVIEDLRVKKDLFKHLEADVKAGTILASNTSSLSITAIASGVRRPELVVGMHFFNPAHILKLIEIVRGEETSKETVETAKQLAEQMGKVCVLARDTPGFIVNRVARPFYGEALRLLGEHVASVEEIDRIMKEEGGFAMGPFELMDLIGLDVNFAVTQSVYEQYFGDPRYRPHPIQRRMVESGMLGKKSGRGFYTYQEEK